MIHGMLYKIYNSDALANKPWPVSQASGNTFHQDDPEVVSVRVQVRFSEDGFVYKDSGHISKTPLKPLQPGRWLDCYA